MGEAKRFNTILTSDNDLMLMEDPKGLYVHAGDYDTLKRALLVAERRNGDTADLMDASQEAQHYDWLDQKNHELQQHIFNLESDLTRHKGMLEKFTEDNIAKIIMEWKSFWMNQTQNSEEDRKNYFNRAFGVDANMKYDLARRIAALNQISGGKDATRS
ncbi:hypothetical protein [Bdellovibrio sp. HCB288]|uniref:hypothetical protein n=1 Tax=Bdellovibrio sp. HCB288 TaxID=3394355 RepID=UPI0039B6B245